LTLENKSRIKIKEVFNHPWVLEFEKQCKEDKIKSMTNVDPNNSSALNSTSNSINNANKVVISLSPENSFDKNNKLKDDKNKINKKIEKSISEKIEEKLNSKFNETKSIVKETEKTELIDLNEIENKLNMSLSKNQEYLNIIKNENEAERKRSKNNLIFIIFKVSISITSKIIPI